jgi:lipid II:glycine glycyltransferase (peptidoglycan interpeptide bridge formation enzyme)
MQRRVATPLAVLSAISIARRGTASISIDIDKRMDEVNLQFAEARELIQDATESLGTTDYSEDAEDAIQAVKAAKELYQTLLDDLAQAGLAAEKQAVERANGQKMKQLDAELETVLEHDD